MKINRHRLTMRHALRKNNSRQEIAIARLAKTQASRSNRLKEVASNNRPIVHRPHPVGNPAPNKLAKTMHRKHPASRVAETGNHKMPSPKSRPRQQTHSILRPSQLDAVPPTEAVPVSRPDCGAMTARWAP